MKNNNILTSIVVSALTTLIILVGVHAMKTGSCHGGKKGNYGHCTKEKKECKKGDKASCAEYKKCAKSEKCSASPKTGCAKDFGCKKGCSSKEECVKNCGAESACHKTEKICHKKEGEKCSKMAADAGISLEECKKKCANKAKE